MTKTSSSEAKAARIYRTWHQKEVDRVLKASYKFPAEVYVMGKAMEIFYDSDKWEEDGNVYPYHHVFDSNPTVYGVKGSGAAKSTASLLGVKSLNGKIPLTLLADTTQLEYQPLDDGKSRFVKMSGKPVLLSSNDCKTLFIPAPEGPIFIRGGKMRVTARGIVH